MCLCMAKPTHESQGEQLNMSGISPSSPPPQHLACLCPSCTALPLWPRVHPERKMHPSKIQAMQEHMKHYTRPRNFTGSWMHPCFSTSEKKQLPKKHKSRRHVDPFFVYKSNMKPYTWLLVSSKKPARLQVLAYR